MSERQNVSMMMIMVKEIVVMMMIVMIGEGDDGDCVGDVGDDDA